VVLDVALAPALRFLADGAPAEKTAASRLLGSAAEGRRGAAQYLVAEGALPHAAALLVDGAPGRVCRERLQGRAGLGRRRRHRRPHAFICRGAPLALAAHASSRPTHFHALQHPAANAGDLEARDAAARLVWVLVKDSRRLLSPARGALGGVRGLVLVAPLLELVEKVGEKAEKGGAGPQEGVGLVGRRAG
jgi:hypothetical protein